MHLFVSSLLQIGVCRCDLHQETRAITPGKGGGGGVLRYNSDGGCEDHYRVCNFAI